ncbi:hypothetical protein [Stutzerimonas kunmingensis]|uniref:hypothetical protein n=1 Tax=Stutzerimonas kunmingensis TaxID=1211807 RepID=UPI000CE2E888|nr:hypothetical protein [Stutzerimonas kunmingensis]
MAVEKSTETPVPAGFLASALKPRKRAENEKISCRITASEAVSLLGKTVLVELIWDDDCEPLWCCVQIAGIVLELEGTYAHPHFMVFSVSNPQSYPDEMFWSDIRTLCVLERRKH